MVADHWAVVWAFDTVQADTFSAGVVQDFDGVAVEDSEHFSAERDCCDCSSRMKDEEGSEGKEGAAFSHGMKHEASEVRRSTRIAVKGGNNLAG